MTLATTVFLIAKGGGGDCLGGGDAGALTRVNFQISLGVADFFPFTRLTLRPQEDAAPLLPPAFTPSR